MPEKPEMRDEIPALSVGFRRSRQQRQERGLLFGRQDAFKDSTISPRTIWTVRKRFARECNNAPPCRVRRPILGNFHFPVIWCTLIYVPDGGLITRRKPRVMVEAYPLRSSPSAPGNTGIHRAERKAEGFDWVCFQSLPLQRSIR